MSKNSESLNRSLYDLLRGKGYKPKMLTTAGKASPVPEDASVFLFNFVKDGTDYGQVSVSIDGSKKLIVYFDDEVENSPSTNTSGTDVSDSWSSLVQHLSQWRFRNGLRSFELKNQDHLESDMAQREYMRKKESVSEGYHPMGKQASYNDNVNNAKIIIQHSRKLEEGEQRYRNIARIFVENANGERFLLPTTKPGIAQVYARHIAEGGTPYDDRAQHINSLVEEHTKMAGFVRATRNGQFNESTQRLVQEGINHYQSLRECLGKMRTHRGYQAYFESWTPSLMEDELDESVNELFVQETMDPRIQSVLPILSKLQKNISEDTTMREVDQLAEWADSLLEGGDGGEASEEEDIDTDGAAGEGTAEEVDDDENITEGENDALNPVGIPEGMLDGGDDIDSPVASAILRRILLQRVDLLAKYGPEKVSDAIGDVAEWVGDVDEIGSSDVSGWIKQIERELSGLSEAPGAETLAHNEKTEAGNLKAFDLEENFMDTVKKVGGKVLDKLGHGSDEDLLKDLKKKAGVRNPENGKPSMAQSDVEKVDEVDMGQYDAVKSQAKGEPDADWDKNFREKLKQYAKELEQRQKEKEVDEGLDSDQKRVNQLGPTEKVKNNNIGKLVGANESFINTDAQAVVSEMDSEGYKGKRDSDDEGGKGEGKATPVKAKDVVKKGAKALDKAMDDAHKKDVKEGQEDLDAILRIIKK